MDTRMMLPAKRCGEARISNTFSFLVHLRVETLETSLLPFKTGVTFKLDLTVETPKGGKFCVFQKVPLSPLFQPPGHPQ